MCYSAMIRQSVSKYKMTFHVREQVDLDEVESFNLRVFPHKEFPVVVRRDDANVVKMMNYSLVPKWSKVRRPKFSTYNARIETLCEKPTWKQPIRSQRCLVGLTSFFESCHEGSHAGNVVEFSGDKDEMLIAAGIFDEWLDKETGEVLESFAIITRPPDGFIKSVGHDRSPFFIREDHIGDWLSEKNLSCDQAVATLRSIESQPMLQVEVERPLKRKKL